MISRLLQRSLAAAWRQFPLVVITGARQVGKTTLARSFLPKARYLTFDDPAVAEAARLNPAELFENAPIPVILDEAQYVPEVLRHLKLLVDQRRQPGQFLVTGSQTFELMRGVSESLAGRAAVLTLPALTLPELPQIDSLTALDDYLWRGSYPELWRAPETDRELWLGSYLATYLERDVRNTLHVGSLRDFDRFLRACALRTGQLLSYADLSRDVGIAPNTAKSWISVLEASQQIFLLEPYHRQRNKRLVKSPKLYFSDTGMLTFLMGFGAAAELPKHALWGAIWENLVVSEVRKAFLVRGARPPLWFWRTSTGEEVDLLIESGPERFTVVESKTAARVDASALRGVRALRNEYGPGAVQHAWIACRTTRNYPLEEKGGAAAVTLVGPDGLMGRLPAARGRAG